VWKKTIATVACWMRLDLKHAQRRYFESLQQHLLPESRWLDLGCGHQIVPAWTAPEAEQRALVLRSRVFVGADLDPAISEHPYLRYRVFARGEDLPFSSNSFDLVTANMVVEHLEEPALIFAEIKRILAPGGRVMFHTPNLRNPYVYTASHTSDLIKKPLIRLLEKREEKDVFPTHYQANTVTAVRGLSDRVGMKIVDITVGGSVGSLNELGPLGVLELPFLKVLSMGPFRDLNSTIIAVLEKPSSAENRITGNHK
jgi:ubiquinone/menaquinone biosynthesis C-methylase UbiE